MKTSHDPYTHTSRQKTFFGVFANPYPLSVLVLVFVFLVPLPPFILDLLLGINLVLALAVLLYCLLARSVPNFIAFPTLLLLTTLLRLALNISSCRLILLRGHEGLSAAGEVIKSFGTFVVQGDFVVGAIIFVIISLVNFLVIAKGSARVAEVAARFSLDSLPGRQMAIDSDLRSGAIEAEDAVSRREDLTRESRFFGSMDGAMKFVQGDAIAGVVIMFVNAICGVSLGVYRGLTFSDSIQTFGVLTVGDGLISVIPSLMISVSAGLVVTAVSSSRSSSWFSSARDELNIILSKVMVYSGAASLALGILPGFPAWPFLPIGIFLLLLWLVDKGRSRGHHVADLLHSSSNPYAQGDINNQEDRHADHQRQRRHLPIGGLTIQLGIDMSLDSHQRKEKILVAYRDVCFSFFNKWGVDLPTLDIEFINGLNSSSYNILVRGTRAASGAYSRDCLFVPLSEGCLRCFGIEPKAAVRHPVTGSAGSWVLRSSPGLESLKCLEVDLASVEKYVCLHAAAAAYDTIDEIISGVSVSDRVASIQDTGLVVARDLIKKGDISFPEVAEIMRRLCREGVSVRDYALIFESISLYLSTADNKEDRQQWLSDLHEHVRRALCRGLISEANVLSGELRVFTISDTVEESFREVIGLWDRSRGKPPLEPGFETKLNESAKALFQPVIDRGVLPILVLCSSDVRSSIAQFLADRLFSKACVRTISYEELRGVSRLQTVGRLCA